MIARRSPAPAWRTLGKPPQLVRGAPHPRRSRFDMAIIDTRGAVRGTTIPAQRDD